MKISIFAALICWVALIFLFSSMPNLRLGLGGVEELVRDLGHAAVYGTLAFLVWTGMPHKMHGRRQKTILCVVLCVAVAILDELNQTRIAGRIGDPLDVLIDSLGVFGLLFILDMLSPGRDDKTG